MQQAHLHCCFIAATSRRSPQQVRGARLQIESEASFLIARGQVGKTTATAKGTPLISGAPPSAVSPRRGKVSRAYRSCLCAWRWHAPSDGDALGRQRAGKAGSWRGALGATAGADSGPKMWRTETKKTGTKGIARRVEASIPPKTTVPSD